MSKSTTVIGYHSSPEEAAPVSAQYCGALLVVAGSCSGEVFDIPDGDISIGRHLDNEIVLESALASRWHCCLRVREGEVWLKDLGSSNGTFVNDTRLERTLELKPGDVIRVGDIALRYIPGDHTERQAIEQLRRDATVDELTGCYNQRYFSKLLTQQLSLHKERNAELSLIIFDLDHFKSVNDDNGHGAGDEMLRSLAEVIRQNGVRSDDIFCRYGGDEFVVLLPRTGLARAELIALRFQAAVSLHTVHHQGQEIGMTISIGVAELSELEDSADLFLTADNALYEAKSRGRNTVVISRPEASRKLQTH